MPDVHLSDYAGQSAGERALRFFASPDFMDNLNPGELPNFDASDVAAIVEWATAVAGNSTPTIMQEIELAEYLGVANEEVL